MTEQKWKGYPGIRAMEAFEFENENQYVRPQLNKSGTQGLFSEKDVSDIDDFTDDPEIQWCSSCRKYVCRWFQINNKIMTKNK